jgi:hypothetical protein
MRQHSKRERITRTPKRVAVTAATMVAMITTVGAPFKWSVMFSPWW